MATVVLTFALTVVFAVIDQLTKLWAIYNVSPISYTHVIPHVLDFILVENSGAAFGLGQNLQIVFVIIAILFVVGVSFYIVKTKPTSKFFAVSVALILGGTIGNLIDRIVNGYVIDFLQLTFFPPCCNFADYCLTVGAVLLIVYLLFLSDKEKKEVTDTQ